MESIERLAELMACVPYQMWRHPWFVTAVLSAPSGEALERSFRQWGWDNTTQRALRSAYVVLTKYPEVWAENIRDPERLGEVWQYEDEPFEPRRTLYLAQSLYFPTMADRSETDGMLALDDIPRTLREWRWQNDPNLGRASDGDPENYLPNWQEMEPWTDWTPSGLRRLGDPTLVETKHLLLRTECSWDRVDMYRCSQKPPRHTPITRVGQIGLELITTIVAYRDEQGIIRPRKVFILRETGAPEERGASWDEVIGYIELLRVPRSSRPFGSIWVARHVQLTPETGPTSRSHRLMAQYGLAYDSVNGGVAVDLQLGTEDHSQIGTENLGRAGHPVRMDERAAVNDLIKRNVGPSTELWYYLQDRFDAGRQLYGSLNGAVFTDRRPRLLDWLRTD